MKRVLLILLFVNLSLTQFAQDVLYLSGSGATPNLTIQSGASVYVQGGYVASTGASGMELDGDLYVGSSAGFTANFNDNMASSSILTTSTGTVHFESNLQQDIKGATTQYYNVVFNNTSALANGLHLTTDMVIRNQVTFRDGLVRANGNMLYVNNPAATAVTYQAPNTSTYSESWIAALYTGSGKLDRDIISSASTYDFPVGSTSNSQLLQVTPVNIGTITRFSASWEVGVNGVTPVSMTECGDPYNQVNSAGEWHLRPANGGVYGSGSFTGGNMTLRAWGLSGFSGLIDNQFGLVWRADGSALASGWQVPNPGCTSLAPFNSSGRTISSNNAVRNNIASFNDGNSQLGIAMTLFILPVELLTFNGYNEGNVNELFWTTSAELNSNYFDVEKSITGNEFHPIGQVMAAGFSEDSRTYKLTDFQPHQGFNYYRLKMVNKDHSFEYSNLVLIQLDNNGLVSSVVSPNPTVNHINIQLHSANDEEIVLQLTDALGRVLQSENWSVTKGNNTSTVYTTGLPAAVYFLRIHRPSDNSDETFRIVKQL